MGISVLLTSIFNFYLGIISANIKYFKTIRGDFSFLHEYFLSCTNIFNSTGISLLIR